MEDLNDILNEIIKDVDIFNKRGYQPTSEDIEELLKQGEKEWKQRQK